MTTYIHVTIVHICITFRWLTVLINHSSFCVIRYRRYQSVDIEILSWTLIDLFIIKSYLFVWLGIGCINHCRNYFYWWTWSLINSYQENPKIKMFSFELEAYRNFQIGKRLSTYTKAYLIVIKNLKIRKWFMLAPFFLWAMNLRQEYMGKLLHKNTHIFVLLIEM